MADTNQRLQEAIAAARGGQLAEARSIAEELTEADPQNAHAWFLRGILSEDEEQGRAYLNKTLEIDPDHKAARKRIEQMQPLAVEEAPAEAEEAAEETAAEPEAEAPEDKTMVADSAAFMAAIGTAAIDETELEIFAATPPAEAFESPAKEEASEEPEEPAEESLEDTFADKFADTMIAQSPFAEEMSAEDLQVDALFAEALAAEEEEPAVDEGLATVIDAAFMADEEPAGAEAGQEDEEAPEEAESLDMSELAEAAAGATMVAQDAEAWFEEEAGEDLWAKVEAEAVPEWLIEDTTSVADETLAPEMPAEDVTLQEEPAHEMLEDTFAAEAEVTQEHDLPDWLLEEPNEGWSDEVDEVMEAYEDVPATVVTATPPADLEFPEVHEAPAEPEEAPAPPRPKKRSSNRNLELLLLLLIVVAVILVAAIAYVWFNPPF